MLRVSGEGTVTGISAVRNEATGAWWSWATTDEDIERAPEFLRPLLADDVKRVRASREQIAEALAWAAELPGWAPSDPKPLRVYDPDR